jgi:hypothetical protein
MDTYAHVLKRKETLQISMPWWILITLHISTSKYHQYSQNKHHTLSQRLLARSWPITLLWKCNSRPFVAMVPEVAIPQSLHSPLQYYTHTHTHIYIHININDSSYCRSSCSHSSGCEEFYLLGYFNRLRGVIFQKIALYSSYCRDLKSHSANHHVISAEKHRTSTCNVTDIALMSYAIVP